ncbi:hypothetical protein A2631_02605 [Candidatus Daviesbacteria bacterium RIFCSPHIGHO2_01_FULL_44_29]|uniref:Phospho-N-acetylmuramoyl-pentapeptide-transferase n=1 Tax=Candidatus Daviesbacteria bacterium RIFCSPHIGHO2_02_FULL_43_12 TaxID=1797776 RepID=A0A1F5KKF8_9BACT|nr:MAG: hypothetical protein A2631_02605 [Candidatus Daviesbacteria bacterium RIFCSPHIGHO2_01_FULL_44_29]OGE41275.1 MAG: hypothetical protein A3D25_02000 [Candidatus Daviesbacteria bacterium RIFCSPHIGHO2_02_FULL_43_12]OGE69476.1 MAG: hypothetical protein A3B55_03740 [Candidatus Daviesbacteria bacterium RIFCSPLOWO2_01_FULL_43_15]
MVQLLGLVLISFFTTSFLLIPFIDYLFILKNKQLKGSVRESVSADTPIHNLLLSGKDIAVPVGGGILLIGIITVLSTLAAFLLNLIKTELFILLFTLLSFGAIGFIDDVKKIFLNFSGKYKGLRSRYIFLYQIIFALISSLLLYFLLGFDNIFIPIFGNIILGWWYIPLAVFAIVSFSNAYNISDGLDGLSSGLLMICLFAFLVLAHSVFDVTLGIFVGIWIGALIAYLYFNVFPARIYLGDAGAYGFGAALAMVGLLTGKIIGLAVIGGVYVVIVVSSLLQIFFKRVVKKKLIPVAPIHMYFKYVGWEEPKIVTRFWLAGIIFAILGLWLAFMSH